MLPPLYFVTCLFGYVLAQRHIGAIIMVVTGSRTRNACCFPIPRDSRAAALRGQVAEPTWNLQPSAGDE